MGQIADFLPESLVSNRNIKPSNEKSASYIKYRFKYILLSEKFKKIHFDFGDPV